MSNLFVSTGRKKLKLYDSAVMFEQGVWFSVLIMLPWARADTEITITSSWFLLSLELTGTQTDTCTNMGVVTHLHTKYVWAKHKGRNAHKLWNTFTKGCCEFFFFFKLFICSDLGEMILCNETDREDDFFIHLGTKQAVALLFMVDSLYKHRQWVWSFPITPSHPLIISTLDSARSDRQSI